MEYTIIMKRLYKSTDNFDIAIAGHGIVSYKLLKDRDDLKSINIVQYCNRT